MLIDSILQLSISTSEKSYFCVYTVLHTILRSCSARVLFAAHRSGLTAYCQVSSTQILKQIANYSSVGAYQKNPTSVFIQHTISGPALPEPCLPLTRGGLHCLQLGEFCTATWLIDSILQLQLSIYKIKNRPYFCVYPVHSPQVLLCQSPVCCSPELVFTDYSQVSFYMATYLIDSMLQLSVSISDKSYFCVYTAHSSRVLLCQTPVCCSPELVYTAYSQVSSSPLQDQQIAYYSSV